MSFVFSADGHVREPRDLYTSGLPASLKKYGMHTVQEGDEIISMAGEKILGRTQINRAPKSEELANFGRPNQKGAVDLDARLEDMKMEGIDAEIAFPSAGLMMFMLTHPEAELASCQLYNDWNNGFFSGHLKTFVRCGILPIRNPDYTVQEIKRLAGLGFTAAMLPSIVPEGVPAYNEAYWEPIFEAAQTYQIVLVLHCGTGRADVRSVKGNGGAIINYTIQMTDAQISLMFMVGSGLLDKFPGAKVAVIESGASWLAGLAERLDEVNEAHAIFVRPKLSLKPSEIIQRQVSAAFQYDRACIMSRSVTGHQALMWGSDYPHHEGTFPNSRKVLAHLFDGIDISETEKADIIGGNAARLFRLPRPEFALAAE